MYKEKQYEDILPPSIAKVPKSYKPNTTFSFSNEIHNIVMPKISLPQGLVSFKLSHDFTKANLDKFMPRDI